MKSILALVTSSPFSSANCHSALAFCHAACEKHYQVKVFFYGDGVLNSNTFISPVSDEKNMCKAWQDLHTQYSTELIVCNTAATKRGLLTADEVESTQAHNLQAPFVAGGLAEFATLSQSVDKVVQF